MKVLHILNELRFSGMEIMLINSSSEWKKYNVETTILSTGERLGEAAEKMEHIGYEIKHIPFSKNKISSFLVFRQYLKHNKFDVIHIHSEGNFFIHVLNSWLTGNKNIVRSFHSIFKPTSIKGRLRRHTDRKVAKLLKVRYLSVGDSVAQNELKNYYTKSKTIFNWYNDRMFFPKTPKFKAELRRKENIKKETFVISTVGNCSCVKRHNLVLETLALLPLHIDWLYLHAGKEEEGFPERKFANKLGIGDNCRFLGSISNVDEILAISDLFIMSSIVEGLGNSALEAMAMGIPTILTKVPGLTDLLKNIDNTIGVESSSLSMKEGVLKIYNLSKQEREELASRIAIQTKNNFSLENGVRKYYHFYKSKISENN
ncbi:glycosyltransferase [Salegentibacter sp. JZCK2]|uniref:glycosyltransferase n=1 Tax=Salegentibacter tibetensis TaxID=2873600 RepID=UPI001CCEFBCD|nr:glycosyltransferase [Salegentibacter tibetensis]MBZ9728692.1 glycosyltransferase [Salegentibacter tibetensis]